MFYKGKGNTCVKGKHLLILHFLIVLNLASSYYGKYKKILECMMYLWWSLRWRIHSQLQGLQANDFYRQNFFNHLKPPTKKANIFLCSITSGQPEPNRCHQRVVKLCIINLLWGIVMTSLPDHQPLQVHQKKKKAALVAEAWFLSLTLINDVVW